MANLRKLLNKRIQIAPIAFDVAYYYLKNCFPDKLSEKVTHHPRSITKLSTKAMYPIRSKKKSDNLLKIINKKIREPEISADHTLEQLMKYNNEEFSKKCQVSF
ncbi:MAG: hypothetical protein ACOH5I_14775 [Oligoflexus sp.]